jgi:hypothetical protein
VVYQEEFKMIIKEIIIEEFEKYLPKYSPPEEYLTKKETIKFLKISLPALHNYSKQGLIKNYRVLSYSIS